MEFPDQLIVMIAALSMQGIKRVTQTLIFDDDLTDSL